jgi:uncharacterized protein (DUF2062 family)
MPRKLFRRWMPDPKKIREHQWLAWLHPWLHHPHLWHVSREGIARGAAIGIFFGLLLPIGQIPVAAAIAIFMRANLPMAAVGTFITNPFTFAPIYFFAYQLGLLLTGAEHAPNVTPEFAITAPEHIAWFSSEWFAMWYDRIVAMGKPLFVGLLVLSIVCSALSYLAVHGFWRLHIVKAWRGRVWSKNRSANSPDKKP